MDRYYQIAILAVFLIGSYFIFIRPSQKAAKEKETLIKSLQVGDKVITIGGIYGKIVKLGDDTCVVEVDDKVRLTFAKSSIRSLRPIDE